MPYNVVRITPPGSEEIQPGNGGYDHLSVQPVPVDQVGPVNVGGILFLPMGPELFLGHVEFFISTDNGATWTLDGSGVSQSCRNWAADWNPTTGLFTVAYLDAANVAANEPIQVRQYDPSTQTWGANLAAGKATAGVLTVRTRSNGDIVVGHLVGGVGADYWVSILSGGVWTDVQLTPPVANIVFTGVMTGEMDSGDNFHMACRFVGAFVNIEYYRLKADNTLDPDGGVNMMPTGIECGNLIVDSAGDYLALVYVDPGAPAGTQLNVVVRNGLAGVPVPADFVVFNVPDSGLTYVQTISSQQFLGPVITRPGNGNLYITACTQDDLGYVFETADSTPEGPYSQAQWLDAFNTSPAILFPVDGLVALLPGGTPQFFFNAFDNALGFQGRYTIGFGALSITCDNPPDGTVGVPYSHFFPASGGTPPYTFSITAGALPDGLSLDAGTGEVLGTPTLAGVFPFTIQVQDSDPVAPATASVDCSITIASGLAVQCNNPPNGLAGQPYTHSFTASGGTAPYTFAIIAGSLPSGLAMDGAGNVTGTPAATGTFNFTLQVTDSTAATATVACSILITGTNLITGGGPSRGGCRRKNLFDWCLYQEELRERRITFPPMCTIPEEYRNLLPWDDTFGAIPPQAVPFRVVGSILTPPTAAGDQVVVQGRVPLGYDGLLTGIFQYYTGNGFEQGSGDILWRIRQNLRYVKDLGNTPYALGTSQLPIPMTEGAILLSNQTFQYLVNVPNLSGNIQIGASQIVCGLLGFYWPR